MIKVGISFTQRHLKQSGLLLACALCFIAAFFSPHYVSAQQEIAPAYEKQLLRISELVGSLHFLELLCKAEERIEWRERMSLILQSEGKTELQRAKLIASFNRGFEGLQAIHRKCSASSREIQRIYLIEAEQLIETVTARFVE